MAVAALDLGRYQEAREGLLRALETARAIDLPEETLACLVALTHLAVERGDTTGARDFAAEGTEVAERRDPERFLPLLRAHLARAQAPSRPKEGRATAELAQASLDSLPTPRRAQVRLALARAFLALGDSDTARKHAATVLQTAGSRGFRLMALEARALMANLAPPDEAELHRNVGQDLARDFTNGLSPDMALAFQQRPFLKYLEADSPEG